jgi:hypothetical protein
MCASRKVALALNTRHADGVQHDEQHQRWAGARACQIDGCGVRCFRFCGVCSRWCCRSHRIGSNWAWRCVRCPEDVFVELGREQHQRERAERQVARDLRAFACGWCFQPWDEFPAGVFRPVCRCHVASSVRELFAGL